MSADDKLSSPRAGQEARDQVLRTPSSPKRNAVQAALQRYLAGELRISRLDKDAGRAKSRKD